MTDVDAKITAALERDGYAVVKGVFSGDEITQMRGEAKAALQLRPTPVNGGSTADPYPEIQTSLADCITTRGSPGSTVVKFHIRSTSTLIRITTGTQTARQPGRP